MAYGATNKNPNIPQLRDRGKSTKMAQSKEWAKPIVTEPAQYMSDKRYQDVKRSVVKQVNKAYGK